MSKKIESKVIVFGRNQLGGFGGDYPPTNVSFDVAGGRAELKFPGQLSNEEIAETLKELAAILEAPTEEDIEIF